MMEGIMGQSRTVIEGWPALMSLEMAARYLSLEVTQFEAATNRLNAWPVAIDPDIVRWRKSDLDRLIKRLSTVPLVEAQSRSLRTPRLADADVEQIARAVARRLGGNSSNSRSLVSIKEACTMLGIARTTLYRLINEDRLATRRIGRRTLIPASEIQTILDGEQPAS
jgi:excisionase family DNA binding protein